jgi:hypothetical protein
MDYLVQSLWDKIFIMGYDGFDAFNIKSYQNKTIKLFESKLLFLQIKELSFFNFF